MHLKKFLLFGLLVAILPAVAEEAADRKTATSLKYVEHELDTRQNKFTAEANKAMEYTNTAGAVEKRTVKSDLGSDTSDTSLPMVGGVNTKLDTKQDDIDPVNDHTAVTYTGQPGGIGQKGIYQATGTYAEQSDNLIDAKTFNAALKNGLDSEFKCSDNRQPGTGICWLYTIHNGMAGNSLPAGYTELEYIESTGTQYIDTGISQARFVHDIAFTTRTVYNLMGNGLGHGLYWGQNRSALTDGYELGPRGINMDSSVRRTIEYNNLTLANIQLSVGGQTVVDSVGASYINPTYEVFHIKNSAEYYTSAKLYGLKVYDANNALVRNFVPAQHGTEIGLYDTVSRQFFDNDGEGVFTAGPPVNATVYIPQNQ